MKKSIAFILLLGLVGGVYYVRYWPTAYRLYDHALALNKAGEREQAIAEMEKIVREYPRHAAAPRARRMIKEVQAAGLFVHAQQLVSDGARIEAWTTLERACNNFAVTEYGQQACTALANFTVILSFAIERGKVSKSNGYWDFTTLPDPYVRIYSDGKLLLETQTDHNSWDPTWNQSATVELRPDAKITFQLWDRDRLNTFLWDQHQVSYDDKIGDWGASAIAVLGRQRITFRDGSWIQIRVVEK